MWSYLEEISIWFLNKKRESSHSNFNRSFPTSLILFKLNQNFPTSSVTFQLRLSFPTSVRTFPLQPEFSTFRPTFLLHSFQFHVGLSKLKLSNFSFFPIALSNYTFPYHIRPRRHITPKKPLKVKIWPLFQFNLGHKRHLISPVSFVPPFAIFDLAKVNYIIELTVYSPCVLL